MFSQNFTLAIRERSRGDSFSPTPSFLEEVFRKVLDAEGRVLEPLECDGHERYGEPSPASRIRVE